MNVFFYDILQKNPFYYRFFRKEKLKFINKDNQTSIAVKPHDNKIYNAKIYNSSLPIKPISKMLSYEDQKDF